MPPIIQVSHLDKYFDNLHVLRDLSFEVAPREVAVSYTHLVGGGQDRHKAFYN